MSFLTISQIEDLFTTFSNYLKKPSLDENIVLNLMTTSFQ